MATRWSSSLATRFCPADPAAARRPLAVTPLAVTPLAVAPLAVAVLLAVTLPVAGCTGARAPSGTSASGTGASGTGTVAGAAATGPNWSPVTLPASGPGRPVVRDVAACAGGWYVAGGYLTPDGATRPALWTSPDARGWTEVSVHPVSAYGPSQLLTSVACGTMSVAIGATSGGVHGNPRVSIWAGPPGGTLTEQPAGFELFGGDNAIGVGRLAGGAPGGGPGGGPGAPGWLIVGAWRDANGQAGAAVWVAPDGRNFRLVNGDPALESDARGPTVAQDAIVTPAGFTLVGSIGTPGSAVAARDPAVWTSVDGLTWRRVPVPAAAEDEELQRVLAQGGGELALGVRGGGFGAWRAGPAGEGWHATGRFGSFAGTGLPMVTGLAAGPSGDAYAIVGDGDRYRLWSSPDGAAWTQRELPATVPVGGDLHRVVLAGGGGRLLLAAEDGSASRLWVSG